MFTSVFYMMHERISFINFTLKICPQDEVENQITAIEALMQSVLSIMLDLHVAKSSKTKASSKKSSGGLDTIYPTASDVAVIRTSNERIEIAGMRAIVAYIHLW